MDVHVKVFVCMFDLKEEMETWGENQIGSELRIGVSLSFMKFERFWVLDT